MFVGYYQILCENGHSIHRDIYEDSVNSTEKLHNFICPLCGARIAWVNLVSETEGNENGYVALEQIEKTVTGICSACNCLRVFKHPTYNIPTNQGVDLRRTHVEDAEAAGPGKKS